MVTFWILWDIVDVCVLLFNCLHIEDNMWPGKCHQRTFSFNTPYVRTVKSKTKESVKILPIHLFAYIQYSPAIGTRKWNNIAVILKIYLRRFLILSHMTWMQYFSYLISWWLKFQPRPYFWKVPDASFHEEKCQKMSSRDKVSCRNPCICSGDACLYGLRLCYSFSAISIGKSLYVYIIYTAIACTVVYYLDAVCCEVWFVRCVYVHIFYE